MSRNQSAPTALGPSASVSATAQIPLGMAWDRFVPIELPKVFPNAKGPIPPVTAVEGQSGRWDEVGRSRIVVLGDGARVHEEITLSDPTGGAQPVGGSARFGYTVSNFTGPLGWMTSEARGIWHFKQDGNKTEILWTYAFRPTNAVARPVLCFIIAAFWKRYMLDGMANVVRILEDGVPEE